MDKDRIKDEANELARKIKKTDLAAGDAAGETESPAEEEQVKPRDLLGKLKDATRQAAEKAREKIQAEPSPGEKKAEKDEEEVA